MRTPSRQIDRNGYAAATNTTPPLDWRAAIDAAERSTSLQDALGAQFHCILLAINIFGRVQKVRRGRDVRALSLHLNCAR